MGVCDVVKALILAAILGVLAAGCTGGHPEAPGSTHPPSPTATQGTADRQIRFRFFGSPPPPGVRCPAPSRSEGAYAVLIGPTAGKPGSMVTMTENTPLFNKAGHYLGPSGKIGFWFNLPFASWPAAYSSQGLPSSNNGVPVIHLGEAPVAGQCSYRVTFRVPEVPPGTYEIVSIEHSGGGSAALGQPIDFRVTL
jgi:hypothetical protein